MQRWHLIEDLDEVERKGASIIGAGVRLARLRLGLSQRQLGWWVGLSQSMISRIETGHLTGIRFRTLVRIVGVLDMAPDRVFPGAPPAPTRRLPGQQVA